MGERRQDHDLFSDAIPETSPSVLQGDDYAGVEGNQVTAGPANADDMDRSRFGGQPINRNRLSVKEDGDGIVAAEVHR